MRELRSKLEQNLGWIILALLLGGCLLVLLPFVSALLSKNNSEPGDKLEAAALDKTLQTLSAEQRIAVKAEMARAGMIE